MLIAKEDDIGKAPAVILPPIEPEEPEEPEWGGRYEIPHYIEVGAMHIVIEVDLFRWARWFEDSDRVIAQTKFPLMNDTLVSTVCLGMPDLFALAGHRPLMLYETMVFCGWNDYEGLRSLRKSVYSCQYATRQQAKYGHMVICATKAWLIEEPSLAELLKEEDDDD